MPGPEKAGRFDIADIVRAHRAALESSCMLSSKQERVLDDIARCRTSALGGHVDRCLECGYERPSYNSCRNRHCPKCQALAQERWIAAQEARMLDVRHFHVVFTLPEELRALARFAPRVVYDALFCAASRTLLEFGKRRGFTVGATLVLHTWTRSLLLHPHVHAIVTGGGLSHDGLRWIGGSRTFLFPVHAMGIVFRNKMLDLLRAEVQKGTFDEFDDFFDPEAFDRLVRKVVQKRWNVYAKPTFPKAKHVTRYLGRYTHRVGISNSRLSRVTDDAIVFFTKKFATATVTPVEFLRRFVQHVLPDRFHKIRHFGLYASPDKPAVARRLLRQPPPVVRARAWHELLLELTNRDARACPVCGAHLVMSPIPRARAPTDSVAP